MLMIPNLYKIAGELLPAVLHVTTRSLASHALSIFCDHQDVMAVRQTGVAMLASSSVQECMDLSLAAHLSAVEGRLPFVHFFDGFRTSDELSSIEPIDPEAMARMADPDKIRLLRDQALDPLRPQIRGTAQNADIYFQNREACNPFYDAMPGIVQKNMDRIAALTGRSYHLFDYAGHPEAEYVAVALCSACEVLEEVVKKLASEGRKVGLVKIRLFRPFDAHAFASAIPAACKVITALDRTKEAGSQAEPLEAEVCTALMQEGRFIRVLGGRYGLSSKEFTPEMAQSVFDNMEAASPKPRFTVGITDDVTHLSLEVGSPFEVTDPNGFESVFFGFGSDGSVTASRLATKIIGDLRGGFSQGYFRFDSKKSGGLTICNLRFSDKPIHAEYEVRNADFAACNKSIYLERGYPMAERLKEGGTFLLNTVRRPDELKALLPKAFVNELARKKAKLYAVDASALAQSLGLGARINLIMLTVFLKLSGCADFDKALAELKKLVSETYAAKGEAVVAKDLEAIDKALTVLTEVPYDETWGREEERSLPADAPAYIVKIFGPMSRLQGGTLPVSLMSPSGIVPTGSSAYEKRTVAFSVPEWNPEKCVQCYECSFVCPHAAIRPYLADSAELKDAPSGFATVPSKGKAVAGFRFRIQVYPEDCVGCGSCADNCPGHALSMQPLASQLGTQKANLAFAQKHISSKEYLEPADTVRSTQLRPPLLQFSACCAGCGETPYVKLLTQMFGEELIIANATGCSSIWGAYMPSIPYAANARGRGPAWGNSLFENNGEYGYGIKKALDVRRARFVKEIEALAADTSLGAAAQGALRTWLAAKDTQDAADLGDLAVKELDSVKMRPDVAKILEDKTLFGKKSVWIVGGDGWAYDIGFDGLDEVIASGENVKVLVLDTEGYSNTGGESSKATQLGAVTGFTKNGKTTPKKNLGRMMCDYGYVYVAHVCLGADMQQTVTAFKEAEAFDGPAIVIALCPCISWGIRGGMSTVVREAKAAVGAGYWPLWRYNPDLAKAGRTPLVLDSPQPTGDLAAWLSGQNRFADLAARAPNLSARLQSELAKSEEALYRSLARDAVSPPL
jgi:pyruvate-ferredoxin/flavodoxin oxidoreductase